MNITQFQRAKQISDRIVNLSRKKKQLEVIRDKKSRRVYIEGGNGSDGEFKLNSHENGDLDSFEQQPRSITVIFEAFIQTSIAVYQREIDDLEKEFNAL
jgi:hypothetical protein